MCEVKLNQLKTPSVNGLQRHVWIPFWSHWRLVICFLHPAMPGGSTLEPQMVLALDQHYQDVSQWGNIIYPHHPLLPAEAHNVWFIFFFHILLLNLLNSQLFGWLWLLHFGTWPTIITILIDFVSITSLNIWGMKSTTGIVILYPYYTP